jgi:hypothetical protein
MKRILSGVLFLSLSIPSLALADGAYDQRVPPQAVATGDGRAFRDDVRDLMRLRDLAARYDTAIRSWRARLILRVEAEIIEAVRADLIENRSEVERDRREVGRDGRFGDREDRRDDRRDFREEREAQRKRFLIASDLKALMGRMRPGALQRKQALLQELIGLARMELRDDRREIDEDRRDRQERPDRHDRRGWR